MTDYETRSDDGDTFAAEARKALGAAIDAHTCDYCGSQSDLYLHREAGVWFCNNETACEARRLQKADTVTTYESGEAFLESLDENDHTTAGERSHGECFTDEVLRERGLSDRLNLDPARVCDTMDEAKAYLAQSPLSKCREPKLAAYPCGSKHLAGASCPEADKMLRQACDLLGCDPIDLHDKVLEVLGERTAALGLLSEWVDAGGGCQCEDVPDYTCLHCSTKEAVNG